MARLAADPIFSALTRPQMIAGVTYSFAIFNLIMTLEIFLITRSFWAFAFAAAAHGIGYVGCVREPRFFDLWIIKLSRCPRVKSFWFWQANVYRP